MSVIVSSLCSTVQKLYSWIQKCWEQRHLDKLRPCFSLSSSLVRLCFKSLTNEAETDVVSIMVELTEKLGIKASPEGCACIQDTRKTATTYCWYLHLPSSLSGRRVIWKAKHLFFFSIINFLISYPKWWRLGCSP